MILIGSRAAYAHLPSFYRVPKDYDIIATLAELRVFAKNNKDIITKMVPNKLGTKYHCRTKNGVSIEFEIQDFSESCRYLEEHLIRSTNTKSVKFLGEWLRVPDLTTLYLVKRSHIYWPVHWEKNIADLHWLKAKLPGRAPFNEHHRNFFELRFLENLKKFGQKKVNLNMTNEKFFSKSEKSIGRVIDHDELHKLVALTGVPAYTLAKKDPSLAAMDEELFNNLPHKVKLNTVMEEAMVIGFERVVIPAGQTGKNVTIKEAYEYGLRRCSTNLSSGWWREFAIDHWPEVKHPDFSHWFKLHKTLLTSPAESWTLG